MTESSALHTQVQDLTARNEEVSNKLQALQQEHHTLQEEVKHFKTDLIKRTEEKEALEVM